ncbi:phosphoribosylglycinamide formyltransferase [Desulfoferrobacter suflitae]|uniref:phosphoribosylglycinamide formyltransferase n=1 Tax=Desulfoferrobacter suflitae TaxID=2865782 RepID=UPI002164744C|nr:phosphoribosylglycinamide formyltransferase [Desulfoferrobacter suflitae]MCK8602539.1 phosphoribosylglycinamide formyltransferase [Desulfoferrobacter suflitae]
MTLRQNNKLRLAVLISGGGTNLQALIDRARDARLAAEIVVVASDRADALGLVRAQRAGIPVHVVDYRSCLQRDAAQLASQELPVDLRQLDRTQNILRQQDSKKRLLHLGRLVLAEKDLLAVLRPYRPDLVCLAGFMRLMTPYFLSQFNREQELRVLNIHPAMLPAFPGQHGYEDTFNYGCKWGGVTVHFVDEGEDTGPIIAQAGYPIWPGDDVETIRQRGLQLEYEVYAQCVNWLAAGQVHVARRASGRLYTVITDPLYRTIVSQWLQQSLT